MINQIENNLNLVHFVIKKMNIVNFNEYEDYYQVGVIGLIYAVKTYNPSLKISFSTYAYVCIKNEILKYIKKTKSNDASLEDKIFDDIRIVDTIIDLDTPIIEKIIFDETHDELYELLNNKLNDIELKIIKMSYGLGCRQYKQKEIANILNVPQYKISRIKNKALHKLKNNINDII